jgi:hypothetical protein
MTQAQFREALECLKLSQVAAAKLFGHDNRTFRRYALGETSVPQSLAILLRLLCNGIIDVSEVEKMRTQR